MSEQFGVTPEALRAHGTSLAQVQTALQQALEATRTVSLPADAYGVICQFFPPLIDPIEAQGTDTISAGVDAVVRTIDGVGATATEYQRTEDANRDSFGGAG